MCVATRTYYLLQWVLIMTLVLKKYIYKYKYYNYFISQTETSRIRRSTTKRDIAFYSLAHVCNVR